MRTIWALFKRAMFLQARMPCACCSQRLSDIAAPIRLRLGIRHSRQATRQVAYLVACFLRLVGSKRRGNGLWRLTDVTAIPGAFQRTFRALAQPAASLSSARSHGPSTCARREKLLLRKTRARCVFSLFPCTCRQAVRPPCRKAANGAA